MLLKLGSCSNFQPLHNNMTLLRNVLFVLGRQFVVVMFP